MALVSKNGQDFFDLAPDIDTNTGEDKNLSGAIAKGYQQYINVTKNGKDYFSLPATPENLAGAQKKGYMLADQYDATQQAQQDLKSKQEQTYSGTSGALLAAGKGASDFASMGLGDVAPAALGATSNLINKLKSGENISDAASGSLNDYYALKAANKQAGDVAWNQQPVAYGAGAAATIIPSLASRATTGLGQAAIEGATMKGANVIPTQAASDAISSLTSKLTAGGSDALQNAIGTGGTLGSRMAQGALIGGGQMLGQGDAKTLQGDLSGTANDVVQGALIGAAVPGAVEGVITPSLTAAANLTKTGVNTLANSLPESLVSKFTGATKESIQLGKDNPILRAQLNSPEGHELVKQTILDAQKAVQTTGKNISQGVLDSFNQAKELESKGWNNFTNLLQTKNNVPPSSDLVEKITSVFNNAKTQFADNLDTSLGQNYSNKADQLLGKIVSNSSQDSNLGTQFQTALDVKRQLNNYIPKSLKNLLPSELDAAKTAIKLQQGINNALKTVEDSDIAPAFAQRNLESSAFKSLEDMITSKFKVGKVDGQPILDAEKGVTALARPALNQTFQNQFQNLAKVLQQTAPDLSEQLGQQVQNIAQQGNVVSASKQAQPILTNYADMLAAKGQTDQSNVVNLISKMYPTSGSAEDILNQAVPKLGWMGKGYKVVTDAISTLGNVPTPNTLADLQVGKGPSLLQQTQNAFESSIQPDSPIKGSGLLQGIKGTGETFRTEQMNKNLQTDDSASLYKNYALNQQQKTSVLQQQNISQSILQSPSQGNLSPELRTRLQNMTNMAPDQQSKEMYLIQMDPKLGGEIRKIINKDAGAKSGTEKFF